MKTRKIVLLVDDHALFRAGLRLILKNKIDADIIEIEKISDVTSLTEEVDVILLDICLPGLNGIDGMTILQKHWLFYSACGRDDSRAGGLALRIPKLVADDDEICLWRHDEVIPGRLRLDHHLKPSPPQDLDVVLDGLTLGLR